MDLTERIREEILEFLRPTAIREGLRSTDPSIEIDTLSEGNLTLLRLYSLKVRNKMGGLYPDEGYFVEIAIGPDEINITYLFGRDRGYTDEAEMDAEAFAQAESGELEHLFDEKGEYTGSRVKLKRELLREITPGILNTIRLPEFYSFVEDLAR